MSSNGHDLQSVFERLSEVESHIPRIGGCEAHEIALSARVASLSSDFADLRASLYSFADEMRRTSEALHKKLDLLLERP